MLRLVSTPLAQTTTTTQPLVLSSLARLRLSQTGRSCNLFAAWSVGRAMRTSALCALSALLGRGWGIGLRGRREGSAQTQRLGNGRRKESRPFGAAGNILTLACGTFVMGCCALLQ
jgi:hypothetical protein